MAKVKKEKKPAHPHLGPDRTAPYPVSRLAPPITIVDLAREIEAADRLVNTRLNSELAVIADQIAHLRDEARRLLEKARIDQDLHRARCNFKRRPGAVYHLYENENNERFFSMLSPADWLPKPPPHRFLGSYKLAADLSWSPADPTDPAGGNNAPGSIIDQLLK